VWAVRWDALQAGNTNLWEGPFGKYDQQAGLKNTSTTMLISAKGETSVAHAHLSTGTISDDNKFPSDFRHGM
jgi:hypothetical protein